MVRNFSMDVFILLEFASLVCVSMCVIKYHKLDPKSWAVLCQHVYVVWNLDIFVFHEIRIIEKNMLEQVRILKFLMLNNMSHASTGNDWGDIAL